MFKTAKGPDGKTIKKIKTEMADDNFDSKKEAMSYLMTELRL